MITGIEPVYIFENWKTNKNIEAKSLKILIKLIHDKYPLAQKFYKESIRLHEVCIKEKPRSRSVLGVIMVRLQIN